MKCIQIFKDGKMDEFNLNNVTNLSSKLKNLSKSHGINELMKTYYWKFEGSDICCYGWYDGDKGFENLHDLPHGGMSDFIDEDSSEKNLYGDIFILKYHHGIPVDINISDYSVFYSDRFDNFSDYSSDNDEDNDEDNEQDINCDDVIIKEIVIEDNEEIINNDTITDDLDYDTKEY